MAADLRQTQLNIQDQKLRNLQYMYMLFKNQHILVLEFSCFVYNNNKTWNSACPETSNEMS